MITFDLHPAYISYIHPTRRSICANIAGIHIRFICGYLRRSLLSHLPRFISLSSFWSAVDEMAHQANSGCCCFKTPATDTTKLPSNISKTPYEHTTQSSAPTYSSNQSPQYSYHSTIEPVN